MNQKQFITTILREKSELLTEDRHEIGSETYGIENHAEFLGKMNPYDNCLWDAVIPGYQKILPKNKKYKVKNIIGMFWLSNGNHKVIVKVSESGYNKIKAKKDLQNFTKKYLKINHGLKGIWIQGQGF
jgi:hypothetical protein